MEPEWRLPTLSSPTTATLARIENHEIYAIRLSLLYQKEAPPLRSSDVATMWGRGTALLAQVTA